MNMQTRIGTGCFLLALLLTGCRSPAMRREAMESAPVTPGITRVAVEDLAIQGQFDARGRMSGKVETTLGELDTKFFHEAELAVDTVPAAYCGLARVALAEHRYGESIRFAHESMRQADIFLTQPQWLALRISRIVECSRLLYEANLSLGRIGDAAVWHRQYLLLHKTVQARAYRDLLREINCARMTSQKRRSDYQTKLHAATATQVWLAVLTAAASASAAQNQQGGRNNTAVQQASIAAASVAAIAAIEIAIQRMKANLDIDLRAIIEQVSQSARASQDATADDVMAAKRASSLFRTLGARTVSAEASLASLRQVDELVASCAAKLVFQRDSLGRVTVTGDLAHLIDVQSELDRVPLTGIPTDGLDKDDALLSRYLTPELYRMAGMTVPVDQLALLRSLMGTDGALVLDMSTEMGRKNYAAVKTCEKRMQEYQVWRGKI